MPSLDRDVPNELRFETAIEDHHRRLDVNAYDTIYVIGDVHGCLSELQRLIERLDPAAEDLLVFTGDLVRKGPDSGGVVEWLQQTDNVVSVRGNNEQGVIDGTKSAPKLDPEQTEFLKTLPLAISFGDCLVVHGGIDHRRRLAEQTPETVLEFRSLSSEGGYERPFWFENRSERPTVFFGHTVLSEPFVTPYAVGLDTGCVYGGSLTAYEYPNGTLHSVAAEQTYQDRSTDKIVTPRIAAIEEL